MSSDELIPQQEGKNLLVKYDARERSVFSYRSQEAR